MRVLVACEYSGTVRDAFAARGHDAWSCDLLPSETEGKHYQGDVLDILDEGWDLLVAHPVCRYLANSGVRWLHEDALRWRGVVEGAAFFRRFLDCRIPKKAIENPVIHPYARGLVGAPTQTVQPWQFGHEETKAVCLWLRGLPPLIPTKIVGPPPSDPEVRKKWARVHRMAPGADREKERSRFFSGIANAMAIQWGEPVLMEAAE